MLLYTIQQPYQDRKNIYFEQIWINSLQSRGLYNTYNNKHNKYSPYIDNKLISLMLHEMRGP